ncbi:MAG: hypothetical protein AAF598_03855 [Bacteroidota bacterium]
MIDRIITYLRFLPHVLLVVVYFYLGISGLSIREEDRRVIEVLGFSDATGNLIIIFMGLVNLNVAILLILKDKILPNLSWMVLFIYSGVYPVLPETLQWISGSDFGWLKMATYVFLASMAAENLHVINFHQRLNSNK